MLNGASNTRRLCAAIDRGVRIPSQASSRAPAKARTLSRSRRIRGPAIQAETQPQRRARQSAGRVHPKTPSSGPMPTPSTRSPRPFNPPTGSDLWHPTTHPRVSRRTVRWGTAALPGKSRALRAAQAVPRVLLGRPNRPARSTRRRARAQMSDVVVRRRRARNMPATFCSRRRPRSRLPPAPQPADNGHLQRKWRAGAGPDAPITWSSSRRSSKRRDH
jgi:hypothetical protein